MTNGQVPDGQVDADRVVERLAARIAELVVAQTIAEERLVGRGHEIATLRRDNAALRAELAALRPADTAPDQPVPDLDGASA